MKSSEKELKLKLIDIVEDLGEIYGVEQVFDDWNHARELAEMGPPRPYWFQFEETIKLFETVGAEPIPARDLAYAKMHGLMKKKVWAPLSGVLPVSPLLEQRILVKESVYIYAEKLESGDVSYQYCLYRNQIPDEDCRAKAINKVWEISREETGHGKKTDELMVRNFNIPDEMMAQDKDGNPAGGSILLTEVLKWLYRDQYEPYVQYLNSLPPLLSPNFPKERELLTMLGARLPPVSHVIDGQVEIHNFLPGSALDNNTLDKKYSFEVSLLGKKDGALRVGIRRYTDAEKKALQEEKYSLPTIIKAVLDSGKGDLDINEFVQKIRGTPT